MLHTFIKLTVADYKQWRAGYDNLSGLRQANGAVHEHVFQGADNPKEAFALIVWNDAEKARAYFASPELRKGMQEAGVEGPPTIFYMNEM